jgi:hypothetical protein
MTTVTATSGPRDDAAKDEPTATDSGAVRHPADTDHPTGDKQAAENAENEPAG